jgi:uncharacterized protein (UPF0332 family)
MTDREALLTQLAAMIKKSERSLRAAEEHLAREDADFASSKACYAVFHLMQAALLTKDKTYSKHSGVISGFSEQFIKTGMFPKEFSEKISALRKDRELGDYGYELTVGLESAVQDVKIAHQIISAIRSYLNSSSI